MNDCCVAAPVYPSTIRRTVTRSVLALLLVVVMVVGGLAIVSASAAAAPAAPPNRLASPVTAAHGLTVSKVYGGAELQKGAYVTNPGTPFDRLTNVSSTSLAASSTAIRFTVGFTPRNLPLLEQTLQAQQTPGSPTFHQWLTTAQEEQMFGPDPSEVQSTVNYFTSLGFQVGVRSILSVSFVGTTDQVNQAFRTTEQSVQFQDGSSALMNTLPLSVPAPIAGGIASINGLDQASVAHPTHQLNPAYAADLAAAGGGTPVFGPAPQFNWVNVSTMFNYSNRAFLWEYFFSHSRNKYFTWQTITPASLNWVYNATPLINAGYNGNHSGKPINIAIVMGGGINPDDLKSYSQLVWNNPNNIWNRLTPVPVDGSFTTNGTVFYTDGLSGEMALDIEYSSTMAPGAHITAVYGPCLCYNVLDDDYATIFNMATLPNIISNSWGGDEDASGNLYGPNFQNQETIHYYVMLLDGRGATVLASSADGGGFDKGTGILAGSYPATDPYVLSVDGVRTAVTDNSGSVFPLNPTYGLGNLTVYSHLNQIQHVSEAQRFAYQSYWYQPHSNYTLQTLPPEGSGGFGTSYWFNQSWWQHDRTGLNIGRSLGSGVSAEADFNQTIYFDGYFQFFFGGTSFACPTTAGEFALIEDYLQAHGHSAYLGNGNVPVWWVGNAWNNGNLTLVPFADIVNGTSFWGNRGVVHGYSWPPGQIFPHDAQNNPTYGNTLPGWDFPTGWGTISVSNFAQDLNYLESLPGTFMTTNSAGSSWNPGAWANMALNTTYTIEANVSGIPGGSSPVVTVKFFPEGGPAISFQPTSASALSPSGAAALKFTLDTSVSPFNAPGYVVFELGNSTTRTLGFQYSWISWALPAGGQLNISVVDPVGGQLVGGYPEFSIVPGIGLYFPPVVISPVCCTPYPNSFDVKVTYNGKPVYNAQVTAQIASTYSLAWQGSRLQNVTDSFGRPYEKAFQTVSFSYTNQSGIAIVDTWNVIQPTTFYVNASYSTARAGTTFNVVPGENVKTTDNYKGYYSSFDTVYFELKYGLHLSPSPSLENTFVPNSIHQSGFYNLLYGWQGELFPVVTNDYTGTNTSGVHVWLGNLDIGGENKFYRYGFSGGLRGVTYDPSTGNNTDFNGHTSVYIPDNESGLPYYPTPYGMAGLAWIAASTPGELNRTFSYSEPCAPTLPNPNTQISCTFNNTFSRNYTSAPLVVLPNPVNVSTQTTQLIHRDFFKVGSNISYAVNVTLPNNDPFLNCFGCNWDPGLEHVLNVTAFVDGNYAGSLTPWVGPNWQIFDTFGNLTGNYGPGIHELRVVVTDSLGHTFTKTHRFIVGSVVISNLGITNTYTVIPYTVDWTLNLPTSQVSNRTFNQSMEILYLRGGCGPSFNPCPIVVNLTERIRNGVTNYNQSVNITMLNLNHFYQGEDTLPPGQYQIIVWLNANHSGSVATAVTSYFVFDAVQGVITGPTTGEIVPLGNVTIAYSYTGAYVQNATLFVFPAGSTSPVFAVGALVPGIGQRGGSAIWPAVQTGKYTLVLALGTPYGHFNASENITVATIGNVVWFNQTGQSILSMINPALLGAILAVIAGAVGVYLGYLAAGWTRTPGTGPEGRSAPKPWEEGGKPQGATALECPTCHDKFETEFALHQHRKIVHGIED